jgi:hypothetical protein
MTEVLAMTKITAIPNPSDERTSLEMDKNGHNPRKLVKRILLVKMAAKKSVVMSTLTMAFFILHVPRFQEKGL